MELGRALLSPEAFGWLASSLTLATFLCADMRRLRCAALSANAAFIAYGALAGLWPVLVLHLVLVPVNLWRLAQAFRAASVRNERRAAADRKTLKLGSDLVPERLPEVTRDVDGVCL